MRTLVIRESEWSRGRELPHPREGSALYNENGYCCLGILAKVCGFSDKEIEDQTEPLDLSGMDFDTDDRHWFKYELDDADVLAAIRINDDWTPIVWVGGGYHEVSDEKHRIRTDDEKIEALRPIFREWGWEIDWRPEE